MDKSSRWFKASLVSFAPVGWRGWAFVLCWLAAFTFGVSILPGYGHSVHAFALVMIAILLVVVLVKSR
jgi:hypothetical protein